MLKNIFLTLSVFCVISTDLNADFKSLPDVQEFEHVVSYDDAVNQLFNGQYYESLEIETSGSQVKKTYVLISLKKKWFVKIIEEDCIACNITSFDSEWILKDDKKKNNLMKAVNAKLILPDKGAVFMFENNKHYIVSYPWAPGKALGEIYIDCFKYNKNSETLKMSFYRYGQVLAISTLDPNNHSDDLAEISNRISQISLDDRHESNEKYFERNQRIYRLDLSEIYFDENDHTVGEILMNISTMICRMYKLYLTASDKKNLSKYFNTKEYIAIPIHYFIAGYMSKLPLYNPLVIESLLLEAFDKVFIYYCHKGDNVFCDLVDDLYLLQ